MKNKKTRFISLVVSLVMILTLFTVLPASAGTIETVDLSTWTAESYPAVSGFNPGIWTVAGDKMSVYQSVNGQPTMFYSDFNAFNTQLTGKITVSGSDNDFIGFALGFQPGDSTNSGADYLLVDWKGGTQSYNFGAPSCGGSTTAPAGLAVSRVNGIPIADEFWGHVDQNEPACSPLGQGLTELARGTNLGSTGWNMGQEYEFKFEFSATSLKVYVDNVLEINISGSFSDGRIAFYNFSQADVTYSGYEVQELPPVEPEPTMEVGGDVYPTNKADLLLPVIGVAAAILLVSGAVLVVRRHQA